MTMVTKEVAATVVPGHGIASGAAEDSPYPKGSLEMQAPYFLNRGLDLSRYFSGTINIDLSPVEFEVVKPDFTFEDLKWAEAYPAETFSFVKCSLSFDGRWYDGYVYYPHPETKIGHFQSKNTLEIIVPRIDGLQYGDRVILRVDNMKIRFIFLKDFLRYRD